MTMVKKTLLMILLTMAGLFPANPLRAQWYDSFEEGLAPWHGHKEHFVLEDGRLCSKGPEKKSVLCLSRALRNADGDTAFYAGLMRGDSVLCHEWGVSLRFVPSTTNRLRIYLFCTDSLLGDSAHALYLQLGQKGSENRWQLFRNTPDTNFMLWQGRQVYSRQGQMEFNLRTVYRPSASFSGDTATKGGYWHLFHSTGEPSLARWLPDGDSLFLDCVEPVLFKEAVPFYSGIMALYQTASRFDKYVFDYAMAGPLPPPRQNVLDSMRGAVPLPSDTVFRGSLPDPFRVFSVPVPGSLVINEILFNPRPGESRFVEIRNVSDSVFHMAGLALGVWAENKWKYVRLGKEGYRWLSAGALMAFAKDARAISPLYRSDPENIHTVGAFPALNDKAGRLRLVWLPSVKDSLSDTVWVDEVVYSEDYHHWLLPDVKGVSLERIDVRKPALTGENWASAAETAGYATPGYENSHCREAGKTAGPAYFVLDPPLVTPDNDGRNDFTYVRWDGRLSGFMCSMTIYDERGRKIKTLCHQSLLGAGGEIRYDATDASGRVLRPGLYVLCVDLIRPDRKRKRLRYPLAVG